MSMSSLHKPSASADTNPPRSIRRRAVLTTSLALCGGLGISSGAHAQGSAAWPTHPIRMIIPFPAGGATDVLGRVIGQKLSQSLGQQVIIENKPGAGGTIGSDAVAKAVPDGYTLLLATSSTHSIGPAINPKIPYNAEKDFTPVFHLATVPNVLVVAQGFPANSATEFARLLREQPGKYNFGSSGIGTIPHLSAELFKVQAGGKGGALYAVHIPYRGTGQVIPDLISGQIAFLMDSVVTAAPHVRDGKLKALGVSGTVRSRSLPQVPTFDEQGIPGMNASTWFGVFMPAKAPPELVSKLNQALNGVLRQPDMQDRLDKLGATPTGGTPEQFAKVVASDLREWSAIIKRGNIKPE